jgi:ABC-type taurine transport system substrate-binding protein
VPYPGGDGRALPEQRAPRSRRQADQASDEWLGTPEKPGNLAVNLQDAAKFLVGQQQIPEAPDLQVFQDALYSEGLEDDVRDE